ncbi:MAG: TspO/MBR family protein [archaeon]
MKIKELIISVVIVFLVAFIGSVFAGQNTNSDWYESIKPSITPPNYVFPIAWTILFILIAISLYFVLVNSKKKQKNKIYLIFGANFIFNILWSFFFFSMQLPLLAFIDIILVWLTIFGMIVVSWKINKSAAYLLIPYLLWVSFASILNILIVLA